MQAAVMHMVVMDVPEMGNAVELLAVVNDTTTAIGTGTAREQAQSRDEGQQDGEPLHCNILSADGVDFPAGDL